MLGYVTIEKPEMKVKEYELYSGYYCGVCKSIARRCGQIPRLALSYDAAFLGLVMAGVNGDKNEISREHCIAHPLGEKTIVTNPSIDYAADVMLILAWFNLIDDVNDEGKLHARALMLTMKGIFGKLAAKYPELVQEVRRQIAKLTELEKGYCRNMDEVAETFAKIMQAIFTMDGRPRSDEVKDRLSDLGYHMGKWIYMMDAWDDVAEDIANKQYNPLVYRHWHKDEESFAEFRDRIRANVEFNLFMYLDGMGRAADVLETGDNSGIIDNIVHMGLLRRAERILRIGLPKIEEEEETKNE